MICFLIFRVKKKSVALTAQTALQSWNFVVTEYATVIHADSKNYREDTHAFLLDDYKFPAL